MINMNFKFIYIILFGLLLIFVASNTNAKTVKLTGRPFATGSSGVAVINASTYFTSSIKIQEIAQ